MKKTMEYYTSMFAYWKLAESKRMYVENQFSIIGIDASIITPVHDC